MNSTFSDLLTRRQTAFVLWLPAAPRDAPELIIGTLQPGSPVTFANKRSLPLQKDANGELWTIPASACGLSEGVVYHYWFEVTDTCPGRSQARMWVTDPLAGSVDWRLLADRPQGSGYSDDDRYPAAMIRYRDGACLACDEACEDDELQTAVLQQLPMNNRLIIYEMPTAWAYAGSTGGVGIGSFCDVTSLIDKATESANFSALSVTQQGNSYLTELGVNALESLPPADSFYNRQWGYGTTNYLAPDYELGLRDYSSSAPNRDLCLLVKACHNNQMRLIIDSVMAFSHINPYLAAATDAFFILNPQDPNENPADCYNSRGRNSDDYRNGFGSTLFRYTTLTTGYDPITGSTIMRSPARQLMKTALARWMRDFQIDGIREDSVENISSWDFVREYRNLAYDIRHQLYPGAADDEVTARFLVVGEELTEPLDLLHQGCLDGLWHENFKKYIRAALVGKNHPDVADFESTVRRAIDCRAFGYQDGAQAIIYLTSHDVEGMGNERLQNYFMNCGIANGEQRMKLAFVCLLTAVGVPMILAGDEFADVHDFFDAHGNVTQDGGKQVDPVHYERVNDDWRRRILNYVTTLVRFRATSDALSVNDTNFIHVDFDEGKRVLVWQRGRPGIDTPVVVPANFSDYATPANSEYRVPNWPQTPDTMQWQEITQHRIVPQDWVAREAIFPWEAKVYTLVKKA